MSGVSGFGSDVRGRMARATGESPRGRIHIPIHRGIDALPSTYAYGRRTNMQEYMDRALRRLRDQTGEAYFIHSGAQGEGGAWPLINFGFKTLLSIDPA